MKFFSSTFFSPALSQLNINHIFDAKRKHHFLLTKNVIISICFDICTFARLRRKKLRANTSTYFSQRSACFWRQLSEYLMTLRDTGFSFFGCNLFTVAIFLCASHRRWGEYKVLSVHRKSFLLCSVVIFPMNHSQHFDNRITKSYFAFHLVAFYVSQPTLKSHFVNILLIHERTVISF